MRMSAIAGAALVSLALTSSAYAQGVGTSAYVYDDEDYDGPTYGSVAPRVYTERPLLRPAGRCGTYHYWNGAYCQDARNK